MQSYGFIFTHEEEQYLQKKIVDLFSIPIIKYVEDKKTPPEIQEALDIMELAKENQLKAIDSMKQINQKKIEYYKKYGNIVDKILLGIGLK